MVEDLYDRTLQNMEKCQHTWASRVQQPKATVFGDGYVFRYQERNIHQALVQKLARVISGLHAARLLAAAGFIQEQGALQRMLDEFNEDILFLGYAVVSGETTDLHRIYLEVFFEEELDDPSSALHSTQKRQMVDRKRIRAYIARIKGGGVDPSRATEAMRTIHKIYSGFVHGASPHIMEMYFGDPPHFHLRGVLGTNLAEEHREDLWNCFYRSVCSFAVTAKAFGDEDLCHKILEYMKDFAQANGQDYSSPPKGF